MKKQKRNKGGVLVADLAYNAQNAQFGLVIMKQSIKPAQQMISENQV